MNRSVIAICLFSVLSATALGASSDCWDDQPVDHYQKNSDYTEIQINRDTISNQELLAIFPSSSKERYYKFPNGLGIYISSYYKGSHTQMYPNRPVWGIYKTDPSGKRILLSIDRFEFSGTVDSVNLKSIYSNFLLNGQEIVLCNRNIGSTLAKVGMLLLPDGQVIAKNSWGGTHSLFAYSSELSYGDDSLSPSLIQKRKMLSYQIRTVLHKIGSQTVTVVINLPDGTTKTNSKTEFLYEPIEIVEAQFEGLSDKSILTQSGFRPINAFYMLNEIKNP